MAARTLEPGSRVLLGAASVLSFFICLAALASADRLGNQPLAILLVTSAGAAGLFLAKIGLTHRPPGWRDMAWDIAVLAAIAAARDPRMHVWQLPGQWLDLLRLSTPGALAAGGIYVVFGVSVQARERRHLLWHESLSLLGLPFLFNLLLSLPATGLMADLGQGASLGLAPAAGAAAVGRALVLGLFVELLVIGLGFSKTGRLPRDLRLHCLIWASAVHAVVTPQIADAAQFVATWPLLGILVAPLAAALAQAGLWAFVFIASGLTIDAVAGRPPVFASARAQWRKGFRNGAIYGAVFGALALLWGAWLAISPQLAADHWASPLLAGLAGAAVFPFLATLVASADETPPFFPRLGRNYRNVRLLLRGIFIGFCVSFAFAARLPEAGGLTRFLLSFSAGALAYAGIELACDALSIRLGGARPGARHKIDFARVYLLYAGLGGFVGGALGWYFDAAQIDVVAAKFRAYADLAYAHDGRAVQDFVIYPLFSKWGMLDLGSVAGGIKLFYSESLSGVINWSQAAPLFSINFVILAALFQRSLTPLRQLFSQQGLDDLVAQAVRVLRWGLWMAPVINTFLKQSAEPSWYNQDGAVRSMAAIFNGLWLHPADFRVWSLVVFTGLLAFDWLRVLIWFDHMGLRVATLVNLTFIGGDKLDEAAARFAGHAARTRVIPEALRRFATWMPLLIPFYIPRGADWDKAWSGAERLQHAPMPRQVADLVLFYELAALWALALTALIVQHWTRTYASRKAALADVPRSLTRRRARFTLSNGLMGTEILADGRGFSEVYATARNGSSIDLTRRPADSLHVRGSFFYLRDKASGQHWSLGFEPMHKAGADYRIAENRPGLIEIRNCYAGIDSKIDVWLAEDACIEFRRVTLVNRGGEPRRLSLASYQELALNETGAYLRDPDFNALHVETIFVKALNALFARNRLLRDGSKTFTKRRMSREVYFHAAHLPRRGAVLEGYEDSRARFRGGRDLHDPRGLEEGRQRRPDDEGLLHTFDPAASLTIGLELPAHATCEVVFVNGHAANEEIAAELIRRCFGAAELAAGDLQACFRTYRTLEPRPEPRGTCEFGFIEDGRAFTLAPGTPRPFMHVLANAGGFGTLVSNDGELHSFAGNERQNAVTPFVWDAGTPLSSGQAIYIVDVRSNEIFAPTLAPLRRRDARFDVVYEPGAATLRAEYCQTDVEMTVFVPPDKPADVRLVTLRNRAAVPRRFRVVPYFDLALAEMTQESLGRIEFAETPSVGMLRFRYAGNDFWKGWGIAATSLTARAKETIRARFIGARSRDLRNPCMVTTGAPDGSVGDDGRRIAAFSSFVEVAAGSEIEFAVVLGQAPTKAQAVALGKVLSAPAAARKALAATRQFWSDAAPQIRVESNHPHFDHLVNHWLHYQVLASRLWARSGPNQRSGAIGFRDQLQDVLPLVFSNPELARSQIVLHARQQFRDGDVLKWWHATQGGRTGLGLRSRASDPHLWLPYVTMRYAAATGDDAIFDERTPYLEGIAVPANVDAVTLVPRASREDGSLYDHCRRAIDYTLARMGSRGLPLIGTGDWNDGLDMLGFEGRGESVWLGFFLFDVLSGFAPLIVAREGEAVAAPYRAAAAKLRGALDCAWRGDHYTLAFADDGREIDRVSAITAAWPVLCGAVDQVRGLAALEGSLAHLEKPDRILLLDRPFGADADPFPGRIADYPPGVRENAGQYSHGATWAVDAYVRLADLAMAKGDAAAAGRFKARAFDCWKKISPLGKIAGASLAAYGLAPYQQAADIYDGCGHDGRGGWSWYTGAAARMLSAAYEILGLRMERGRLRLPADLFAPKGELVVHSVAVNGKIFTKETALGTLDPV